jgi:DNA helicase-2/ATP-dependent DNA helicase PcrA
MFKPRPKQQEVLNYSGGRMGVSAVPGSGKTATLSYLAARLVATTPLADDQEILVVTLVKSAVGNFSHQMAGFLREEFGLLPGWGYRVRTLHGLANDIVRERPGLVGLSEGFSVIDEREADDILSEAVETWARTHTSAPDAYLSDEHYADAYTRTTRWPDVLKNIAGNFIRQAKDQQLSVQQVRSLLDAHSPATRPTAPTASACCGPRPSIWKPCRRSMAAAR